MTKKLAVIFATIGALLVTGYLIILFVLKPVSTDLSMVGQGKPSLVLAYENFSPTGGSALEQIRKVRAEYESRLVFIVADVGTPQGQDFAQRYRLVDGQILLLDPQGKPLRAWMVPADAKVFRTQLDDRLALLQK